MSKKTLLIDGNPIGFLPDGGGSGGGHVIQNQAGTDLAQEPNMQFADLHTSDDSTNEVTVVQAVKPVTAAAFEALPTTGAADGLYLITDGSGGGGGQTTANMVSYDNTNSGMTATNVQDAVDELNADINKGYVEVTADGIKTYPQLLNSLYTLVDLQKVSHNCKLVRVRPGSDLRIFYLTDYTLNGSSYSFSSDYIGTSVNGKMYVKVGNSNSAFGAWTNGSYTPDTSVPDSGTILTFYY